MLFLSLRIYLATPFAASQLSRLLTSYLHQTTTVSTLRTTGGTIYLKGITLANPAGFPAGYLATADTIAIAPQWGKLLLGRQGFRLIALEGVKLDMRKGSTGAWNYSGLQQAFSGRKPATRETFIKQFVIRDGSFQVNGQGVKGVSVQIFNLATLGSAESRIELTFEDVARNRYAITGKARPGKEMALDLALSAPSLSLTALVKTLPPKYADLLKEGQVNLQVNTVLQDEQLRIYGSAGFNRISLPTGQKKMPLTGILNVKAAYDLRADQARIETLNLNVNNLLKMNLAGTVNRLRHERSFSASIGIEGVDLGMLAWALPEKEQRRMVLGGVVGDTKIRISGNAAQGITSASGALQVHDASLVRDGRTIVSGLGSEVRFYREGDGILVNGRLFLGRQQGKPMLEALDAPFTIKLSRRLQLLSAETPALYARIMAIPVTGRLGFKATEANPLSASLQIPDTKISALKPLLDRFNLQLASGTASFSLEVAGRGAQDFTATATAQLAALLGQRGESTFALKQGKADCRLSWSSRRLAAAGNVQLSGMATAGQNGEARFAYRFADRVAVLDHAVFRLGSASAAVDRISARIPVQESKQGTVRYPLLLEISGAEIQQKGASLRGLSGSANVSYASGQGGKWLEGTADVATGQVAWQGKRVGAPAAHIVFAPSGARVNLSGTLLDGELLGDIFFKPFALDEEVRFTLAVKKGQLAKAGALLPGQQAITVADGRLDGSLSGGYSRQKGLACVFEARGESIALNNNANKSLVAGAGLRVSGELAGATIAIREAVFTAGDALALTVRGKLADAFTARRQGEISFALPQTPVNGIIDPFVNILPRFLQEATTEGELAAAGTVRLQGGKIALNGALAITGGRLDMATQKFSVADVNGSLPFSMNLPGGALHQGEQGLRFTRGNFPGILKQLRQRPVGGQSVTVGKASFGPLDLGSLTLHVQAGNGITEITSLSSSFIEGELLGRGFISVEKGLNYRGDFLVHDLSLVQLCNRFPAIKGYVSGRLDGIISLYGQKKGLEGLTGFTELWAREGSGEKMLVSKEFLQRLSGKKLRGFFFRSDRPFDLAEINATLEKGYLTFETLNIEHTNLFGVRDLSVSIAPTQNSIALDHLLNTIKQATVRGKAATGADTPTEAPIAPEFKWEE